MASPIQIVLNHDDFHEARQTNGGGSKTDFFAHRDHEFTSHKQTLRKQLSNISSVLLTQSSGAAGVVKVVLQRRAWAKSHRPVSALFKNDVTPVVGGGDIGVMFVEAVPEALSQVAEEIEKAEINTRMKWDERLQKDVPKPSVRKSETGAIDKIELYSATDRRNFSSRDAVAWLSNGRTGGAYIVQLFFPITPRAEWDLLTAHRRKLLETFLEGLKAFESGLVVQDIEKARPPAITIRLDTSDAKATYKRKRPARDDRVVAPFDSNVARHDRLLTFLDAHPLVRRIELPGLVERTAASSATLAKGSAVDLIPNRTTNAYPSLGVIDGGVSEIIAPWILDRWDVLADEHLDTTHGTFIAGLSTVGQALNGTEVCADNGSADIVDIAVFPSGEGSVFESYYPDGLLQFFDEIDNAVSDAKSRHGTRVFNMSLNITQPASPDQYSLYAARLDKIAEDNNVLLILSAGNTTPQNMRPEWPQDATVALGQLALARNDELRQPAESVRNVAVGAVNPPGHPLGVPHAPARYSCRGPGLRAGVKPDLAHFGGCGTKHPENGHGLFSLSPEGMIVDDCGTSYASPLVAKTAAILDHAIEGEVSRETLIALLIHNAAMPKVLADAALEPVARHLVGFGIPAGASQILETDDHSITLVFASRLMRDKEVNFKFAWPACLVGEGGSCRGRAKLTLVSSPPLNPDYGSEFVRVNINAALQQDVGDNKWKGRLDPLYIPKSGKGHVIEAELIEHDLKWSSVKAFAKKFAGVGSSSTWRLNVEYLTRSGEEMPKEGVPFTAILTISDPKGERPVFNDMRQNLMALGTTIADIRTAARIASRT